MHHLTTLAFTQALNLLVRYPHSFSLAESDAGYCLHFADQRQLLKRGKNLRVREDVVEGALCTLGDLKLDSERCVLLSQLYMTTSHEFDVLLSLCHLIRQMDISGDIMVGLAVDPNVCGLGVVISSHERRQISSVASYLVDSQRHTIGWLYGDQSNLTRLTFPPYVTELLATPEVDYVLQNAGISHQAIHAAVEQIADDPLLWNWSVRLLERCAQQIDAQAIWRREGTVVRLGLGTESNPAILLRVHAQSNCDREKFTATLSNDQIYHLHRTATEMLAATVEALLGSQWASVWDDVRLGYSDIVCQALASATRWRVADNGWVAPSCEGFSLVLTDGQKLFVSFEQDDTGVNCLWVCRVGSEPRRFPCTLRGWRECLNYLTTGEASAPT